MKLKTLIGIGVCAVATAFTSFADECYGPMRGIIYYTNPVTGGFRLYFSFELEPDHLYRVEVTTDAKNYELVEIRDTTGNTFDIYESFSVDPCNGIWPRIIDLGPTVVPARKEK